MRSVSTVRYYDRIIHATGIGASRQKAVPSVLGDEWRDRDFAGTVRITVFVRTHESVLGEPAQQARGLRRLILPSARHALTVCLRAHDQQSTLFAGMMKADGQETRKREQKGQSGRATKKHPTIPSRAPVRNHRVPGCRTVQLQPPPMSCKGQTDNCPVHGPLTLFSTSASLSP